MRIIPAALLVIITAVSGLSALTLSEKEAVMWALEADPDIMVSRISVHGDSLGLAKTEAGWLPGMDVSVETGYRGTSTTAAAPGLENGAAVTLSQNVAGGGRASLALSQQADMDLDTSLTAYNTGITFSYTQPLLKNAWNNAPLDLNVRISRLKNRAFTLQQKKAVLAELSGVRTSYWSYYEQKELLRIAEDALAFAEQRYGYELARFRLGQTAELDTLNAAVTLLQARKNLLNARNGARQARKELGVRLMLAGDAVEIPESPDASVGSLPSADEFLRMAEAFDPQLKIFELTRQRLEHQYRADRNELLPSLDAGFSYTYSSAGDALFAEDAVGRNALVSLVLGWSLPLKSARIDAELTRLSQKETEIQRKQYRFRLKNRVTDLVETWELERTGLDIMRKTAEAADRQLEAAQAGYRLGSVSRLELLEAENTRTRAAADYVRARVTMKRLEIIFDEITGKLFDTFGVTL